jgi:2-oxoisovalerate dehydrogenase E2 component (dihydrolipoyl transacylase)
MSRYVFKLPDLGEGTVEAEIVAWHVKAGDTVAEDQAIVEVMTDKAAVEVPAPVSGVVVSITGEPGDKVAVGTPLIVFDMAGGPSAAPASTLDVAAPAPATPRQHDAAPAPGRVMTSPANRRRAREAGIDLATVSGTGPGGRILREDLAATLAGTPAVSPPALTDIARQPPGEESITEVKVIGVRRVIAERMSEAKRNIPHFAYVEEVDVTELEALRRHLNLGRTQTQPSLSYLPFVVLALVRVLRDFPQCNVRHDAERGVLQRHAAVHVGIATQTPEGLKVPVVRHAQALGLWELAAAIHGAAGRARSGQATRQELMGSTITVTSLGKLGGIVSTPVINAPEVAIVGLNKAMERPVVHGGAITVRRIMNLSSSFDHRFVDGYDAAAMIQALKENLEHPAAIFLAKV